MSAEPEVLAGRLAEAAGLAPVESIDRLTGGKNNRVFGVTLSDGRRVVMKSYHHDERDTRDRLGAEWSFLRYVWGRGVRNVPEPLAAISAEHAGLYGFIEGTRATEVTEDLVDAAADFVAAINTAPREPQSLAPGSEACFSIADHVATVSRRVGRLATLDETAPHVEEARAFVRTLEASWQRVEARIVAESAANGVTQETPVAQQIVSPSDFGFHNALVQTKQVSFIDFEYAGRDDLAKLVCDFFCQPEVPVPLEHYARFRDSVIGALNLTQQDAWRCDLLLDAYRIKWVCIILNEFLPLGASRRAFADASDRAARAERQLARATRQLSLVTT
jgi:Ser/Thr protein kinase RdoA (MazF antagonist)